MIETDWAKLRSECALIDDEAILAMNKPAGVSVMGERHDTDLVRMAADSGEQLFPVHRIDKATSGLILFAKQLRFHGDLTRQFNKRTVTKTYLAFTRTKGLPPHGVIDLPLSEGRKNRVRVAAPRESIRESDGRWSVAEADVLPQVTNYPSVTEFTRVWENKQFTLLAAQPITGRRHQIRVHLAWAGHPVHGDQLFEKDPQGRTLLHSWALSFEAQWRGGERITLEAPPGDDFFAPVRRIGAESVLAHARGVVDR